MPKQLTSYDPESPWGMQPCDSDESFAAFEHYLGLDPPRGLSKLTHLWPMDRLVPWREHCGWVERAFAIDRERQPAISERDDRHLTIVQTTAEIALIEIKKLLTMVERNPEKILSVKEMARLVRESIQLERLVTGGSTENVAVAVGPVDLTKLTVDELEDLRRLEAKAGVE